VLGAALLALLFLGGNAGPFGIGALYAGLIMAVGVLLMGAFVAASLLSRSGLPPWRTFAAAVALIVAVGLLTAFLADIADLVALPVDPLWAAAGAGRAAATSRSARQPGAERLDVGSNDLATTAPLLGDQARPLEHGDTLLDGGEADWVVVRELGNALPPVHRATVTPLSVQAGPLLASP